MDSAGNNSHQGVNKILWSIIGCALQDRGTIPLIVAKLRIDSIVDRDIQSVLETIIGLDSAGSIPDRLSIEYAMGRSVDERYWSFAKAHANISNLESYLSIVADFNLKRSVSALANTFANTNGKYAAESGLSQLSILNSEISKMMDSASIKGTSSHYSAMASKFLSNYRDIVQNGRGMAGRTTGIHALDQQISGLTKGYYILAARPSMGKTTLALNFADHVAAQGDKVMIFSVEMPEEELYKKSISSYGSGIDYNRIRNGTLSESEMAGLVLAMDAVSKYNIVVDATSNITVSELFLRAITEHKKGKISLIVIDYIQLMSWADAGTDNKTEGIGFISRQLKLLSDALDCPVIVLSQLNRDVERRADKRPMNSDLRDSGALEQDADVIMFVYRDEYYNEDSPDKGVAELIISKQRLGSLGTIRMKFAGSYSRFENLSGPQLMVA